MQGRITNGPLTLEPGMPESPHILPQCIYIVTNNRRLSAAKYQKLREHYEQCVHCQVLSGYFLRITQREEQTIIDSITPLRAHLLRFITLLHSIARKDIAAYIDVLEEHGVSKASERFPTFAEHLDSCQECQCSVEECRKWFQADQKNE